MVTENNLEKAKAVYLSNELSQEEKNKVIWGMVDRFMSVYDMERLEFFKQAYDDLSSGHVTESINQLFAKLIHDAKISEAIFIFEKLESENLANQLYKQILRTEDAAFAKVVNELMSKKLIDSVLTTGFLNSEDLDSEYKIVKERIEAFFLRNMNAEAEGKYSERELSENIERIQSFRKTQERVNERLEEIYQEARKAKTVINPVGTAELNQEQADLNKVDPNKTEVWISPANFSLSQDAENLIQLNDPAISLQVDPEVFESKSYNEARLKEVLNSKQFNEFLEQNSIEKQTIHALDVSSGGLNVVYKLEIADKIFALRLNRENAKDLDVNIEHEVRVLQALKDNPNVVNLVYSTKAFTVFDYVEGGNLTRWAVSEKENLTSLVNTVKAIHALEVDVGNRDIVERLRRRFPSENQKEISELSSIFEAISKEYEELPQELKDLRSVIHNDIAPRNIMNAVNGPLLLDFELVTTASPFQDIAALSMSAKIEDYPETRDKVLKLYFGKFDQEYAKAVDVFAKLELIRQATVLYSKELKSGEESYLTQIFKDLRRIELQDETLRVGREDDIAAYFKPNTDLSKNTNSSIDKNDFSNSHELEDAKLISESKTEVLNTRGLSSDEENSDLAVIQKRAKIEVESKAIASPSYNQKRLTEVINSEKFQEFIKENSLEKETIRALEIADPKTSGINVVYKIQIGQDVYALRLNREKYKNLEGQFRLEDEMKVLNALADHPSFVDAEIYSEDFVLFKYIEGGNILKQVMYEEQNLTALVSNIKELHALNLSIKNHDTLEELKQDVLWVKFVVDADPNNYKQICSLETRLNELEQEYNELSEETKNLKVVSHRDIGPRNIINGENGPVLIDLERVAISSPFVDLADLVSFSMPRDYRKTRDQVLEDYFGEVTQEHINAIEIYIKLELIRKAAILTRDGNKERLSVVLKELSNIEAHSSSILGTLLMDDAATPVKDLEVSNTQNNEAINEKGVSAFSASHEQEFSNKAKFTKFLIRSASHPNKEAARDRYFYSALDESIKKESLQEAVIEALKEFDESKIATYLEYYDDISGNEVSKTITRYSSELLYYGNYKFPFALYKTFKLGSLEPLIFKQLLSDDIKKVSTLILKLENDIDLNSILLSGFSNTDTFIEDYETIKRTASNHYDPIIAELSYDVEASYDRGEYGLVPDTENVDNYEIIQDIQRHREDKESFLAKIEFAYGKATVLRNAAEQNNKDDEFFSSHEEITNLAVEYNPKMRFSNFDEVISYFSKNPYLVWKHCQDKETREMFTENIPWTIGILQIAGIYQPQKNEKHDPWRQSFSSLVSHSINVGLLDPLGNKNDIQYLKDFVSTFGMNNTPYLLKHYVNIRKASDVKDIESGTKELLKKLVDSKELNTTKDYINALVELRRELIDLLLVDELEDYDHINEDLVNDLVKSEIGKSSLGSAYDISELADDIRTSKVVEMSNEHREIKFDNFSFQPSRKLARALVGDISNTSIGVLRDELSQGKYEKTTSYTIVENRGEKKQRISGSFLIIETELNGEKTLVLRANNPHQRLASRIDVEKFLKNQINQIAELAKRLDCDHLVLSTGNNKDAGSNVQFVTDFNNENFSDLRVIELENCDDTNLNGRDIWNPESKSASRVIWSKGDPPIFELSDEGLNNEVLNDTEYTVTENKNDSSNAFSNDFIPANGFKTFGLSKHAKEFRKFDATISEEIELEELEEELSKKAIQIEKLFEQSLSNTRKDIESKGLEHSKTLNFIDWSYELKKRKTNQLVKSYFAAKINKGLIKLDSVKDYHEFIKRVEIECQILEQEVLSGQILDRSLKRSVYLDAALVVRSSYVSKINEGLIKLDSVQDYHEFRADLENQLNSLEQETLAERQFMKSLRLSISIDTALKMSQRKIKSIENNINADLSVEQNVADFKAFSEELESETRILLEEIKESFRIDIDSEIGRAKKKREAEVNYLLSNIKKLASGYREEGANNLRKILSSKANLFDTVFFTRGTAFFIDNYKKVIILKYDDVHFTDSVILEPERLVFVKSEIAEDYLTEDITQDSIEELHRGCSVLAVTDNQVHALINDVSFITRLNGDSYEGREFDTEVEDDLSSSHEALLDHIQNQLNDFKYEKFELNLTDLSEQESIEKYHEVLEDVTSKGNNIIARLENEELKQSVNNIVLNHRRELSNKLADSLERHFDLIYLSSDNSRYFIRNDASCLCVSTNHSDLSIQNIFKIEQLFFVDIENMKTLENALTNDIQDLSIAATTKPVASSSMPLFFLSDSDLSFDNGKLRIRKRTEQILPALAPRIYSVKKDTLNRNENLIEEPFWSRITDEAQLTKERIEDLQWLRNHKLLEGFDIYLSSVWMSFQQAWIEEYSDLHADNRIELYCQRVLQEIVSQCQLNNDIIDTPRWDRFHEYIALLHGEIGLFSQRRYSLNITESTKYYLNLIIAKIENLQDEGNFELASKLSKAVYTKYFSSSPDLTEPLRMEDKLLFSAKANRIPLIQSWFGQTTIGDFVYHLSFARDQGELTWEDRLTDYTLSLEVADAIDFSHLLNAMAANAAGNGYWAEPAYQRVLNILENLTTKSDFPIVRYAAYTHLQRAKQQWSNPSVGVFNFMGSQTGIDQTRLPEPMLLAREEESNKLEETYYVKDSIYLKLRRISKDTIGVYDRSGRLTGLFKENDPSLAEQQSKPQIKSKTLDILIQNISSDNGSFQHDFSDFIKFFTTPLLAHSPEQDLDLWLEQNLKVLSGSKWKEAREAFKTINYWYGRVREYQSEFYQNAGDVSEKASIEYVEKFKEIMSEIIKEDTSGYFARSWKEFQEAKGDGEMEYVVADRTINLLMSGIKFPINDVIDNNESLFKNIESLKQELLRCKEIHRSAHKMPEEPPFQEQYEKEVRAAKETINLSNEELSYIKSNMLKVLEEQKQNMLDSLIKPDVVKLKNLGHEFLPFDVKEDVPLLLSHMHNPIIRQAIEADLETDLNQVPLRSQIHLLRFIASRQTEEFEELRGVLLSNNLKNNPELKLKVLESFIANAENEQHCAPILELARNLNPEQASKVFGKYLEIVDSTLEMEKVLTEFDYDKSENQIIIDATQRILSRANEMLADYSRRAKQAPLVGESVDELVSELNTVNSYAVATLGAYKSIKVIAKQNNEKVGLDAIKNLEILDAVPGSDIEPFHGQMEDISHANVFGLYADPDLRPGIHEAMLKALKNPNSKFYLMVKDGVVIQFLRIDEKEHEETGEKYLYLGSVNGMPLGKGWGTGAPFIASIVNRLGKDMPIELDCWDGTPAVALYKALGFEEAYRITEYKDKPVDDWAYYRREADND